MHFLQLLKEAFGNLWVSKLRSVLTLLGILIGTASVVALVSSGQLATQHALAQFKTLGTDLLAVTINSSGGQTDPDSRIDLSKMAPIRAATPDIAIMAPYSNYFGTITYKGTQIDGGVIGAAEELQQVIKIPLLEGRFVNDLDRFQFFAVIGNNVAQKMKAAGAIDPLGEQISVGSNVYTVIGVAQAWPQNMFMFADIDNSVIVPISNSFLLSKYVQIQNIIFRLKPDSDIDAAQNKITAAVNTVVPNQQLFFRSAKQLIESMQKQRQTLTLLLTLIAGISLVVGGIGVMNIMLVSVIERRREIGIRLAVGATGSDIAWMFITEAVVLTVFGGLIGVILGVLVSYIASKVSGWGFEFFLMPPLVGFSVSFLVGMISGFYPAYKASRLDPITTLRSV